MIYFLKKRITKVYNIQEGLESQEIQTLFNDQDQQAAYEKVSNFLEPCTGTFEVVGNQIKYFSDKVNITYIYNPETKEYEEIQKTNFISVIRSLFNFH